MPIDRFGNTIAVGWAAHEDLWLNAAMSLMVEERRHAYMDICSMTGRSYGAVLRRVYAIRKRRQIEADRRVLAAFNPPSMPDPSPRPEPLLLPSLAALMGGRSVGRCRQVATSPSVLIVGPNHL